MVIGQQHTACGWWGDTSGSQSGRWSISTPGANWTIQGLDK